MKPTLARRGLIDLLNERRAPDNRRFAGKPFIVDKSGKVVSAPRVVVPGAKYFVFPALLSLEEWQHSGAAEAQAALVADARSDFEASVVAERPEGEPPIYSRHRGALR